MSFDLERLRRRMEHVQIKKPFTNSHIMSSTQIRQNSKIASLPTSPQELRISRLSEPLLSNCLNSSLSSSVPAVHLGSDISKPTWFYLLGQNSSGLHHVAAVDSKCLSNRNRTQSKLSIDEKKSDLPVGITEAEKLSTSFEDVSFLSSFTMDYNKDYARIYRDIQSKLICITIPKSDLDYGFTLESQLLGNSQDQHRTASTPLTSPTQTEKPMQQFHCKCSSGMFVRIQSVRTGSAADFAGLPVGSYVVGINGSPINRSTSLKEIAQQLLKVTKGSADGVMRLELALNLSDLICNQCKENNHFLSNQNNTKHLQLTQPKPMEESTECGNEKSACFDWNGFEHNSDHLSVPWSASGHHDLSSLIESAIPSSREWTNSELLSVGFTSAHLPSAGAAILCEERCVDLEPEDLCSEEAVATGGSLRRPKRLLTFAPPVLNLKWEDVSSEEADRQLAIASLLSKLETISNQLLKGVRAYRMGLQKFAGLAIEDLNALFHNIVEVACLVWRLHNRLHQSCLPYQTSSSFYRCNSNSKSKFAARNQNESHDSLDGLNSQRKPKLFARLRKSIVDIRRRASKYDKSQHSICTNGNIQESKVQSNEHSTTPPDNTSFRSLQLPATSPASSAGAQATTSVGCAPIHGHLDNPGSIILACLDSLLLECTSYSDGYPDRLKCVHELKRSHPELRLYLRNQAIEPGVPVLSTFLTLPLELMRQLATGLERIMQCTSSLHVDRPALQACIQKLNTALHRQTALKDEDCVSVLDPDLRTKFSSLSHNWSQNNSVASKNRRQSVYSVQDFDLNFIPMKPKLDSNECYQQPKLLTADKELLQLAKYLKAPLIHNPNDSEQFNLEEWGLDNRHIIYRGPLTCTLKTQFPEHMKVQNYHTCYSGPSFVYLLNDALLLVAAQEDVLTTFKDQPLIHDPIILESIEKQDYESSDHTFTITLNNGTCLVLGCDSSSDKLVWKALLEQRIGLCISLTTYL